MLTIDLIKEWLFGVMAKYPQMKRIYIDETGLGQYLPDELSKAFPKVESIGLNFASKETKEGFHRIRSEIFFDLKEAINNGLHFSPFIDKDLLKEAKRELCAIEYKIGNKSERYVLEKDKTKDILGHSPDIADSLALMCHDSGGVSREKIDNAVSLLKKSKKYYNNRSH